jgi:hypothetical protein
MWSIWLILAPRCDNLSLMGLDLRNFALRCYLTGVAACNETTLPRYGDLHKVFGGGNQNQGGHLQAIYEDCIAHDEPDLTVLAVRTDTGYPSVFEEEDFVATPDVVARWQDAVAKARAHPWSNRRFIQAGYPRSG